MDVDALLSAALTALPGAQERPGQRAMARAVSAALGSGEHLLVQAGTGTGKSLGYLVPALAAGRRVVVATATRALQAQLVGTDLPRLADALEPVLGRRPRFALAKGRSNYACLQQLSGGPGALQEPDALFAAPGAGSTQASSALGAMVVRLRGWATGSPTGDRDDVPFPVSDLAWRQVSVSARDCLGSRCPDREACFAERAREQARTADIVVANHALLALDAFTGLQVLPEHDAVIIDEAHEFASAATEALTRTLSGPDVRRAVAGCTGLVDPATAERLAVAADAVEDLLAQLPAGLLPALPPPALPVLRLLEAALSGAAGELGRAGGSGGGAEQAELERARRDRARTALTDVQEALDALHEADDACAVYAVGAPGGVALRVSPLRVGGAVRGRLLADVTLVATSATLTLGGSFAAAARDLGLPARSGAPAQGPAPQVDDDAPVWRWLDAGSPFDAARQGQLWIAEDLPDPGREPQAWAQAVDALLVELAVAAGGRTLGLFTSSAAAARAAAALRAATDLPVLLQGEDSAAALVARFAADARTCLLGTRSFWQGVDVPGSACQLVVIDRLPFGHVEDPLLQARLAAAGPRGFTEVQVPPAAVLLAQGAGRLLRGDDDRGVVAVLDPRLARAGYARVLLDTLPPFYRARSKRGVLASLRAIDASAPPVRARGRAPVPA